jgi:hypothetical protein
MTEKHKPPNRKAYVFKPEGKRPKQGRWLECGIGRLENDGSINVFLDRTPVRGFSGIIHCPPIGGEPPAPEPERPARHGGEHDDEDGSAEDHAED